MPVTHGVTGSSPVRTAEKREKGGLAQLARASALHAEGQRFESVILHKKRSLTEKIFDMLETEKNKKRRASLKISTRHESAA